MKCMTSLRDRRKILVQGVIDCLWWEEDGWVLLDYKSDRVQAGQIEEIFRNIQVKSIYIPGR